MGYALDSLRVVLVAPRNPLNIGAAARAMANFGVSSLRVVTPFEADFRSAPSAVGAEEILARAEVFSSVADAIADCSLVVGTTAAARRQPMHLLYPLHEAAAVLKAAVEAAVRGSGAVALLFGSEKRGLSNEELAYCHWLLYIPTAPEQPSLNLGQAVAVCLYELARDSRSRDRRSKDGRAQPVSAPAASADLERLTRTLLDALQSSGYILPEKGAVTEQSVRRLVRRLNPSCGDAELLLGMLHQVLWKLRRAELGGD